MFEALPMLLTLIIGIGAGIAIERLRSSRRETAPVGRPVSEAEDLGARLDERTREVEALMARIARMERLEKDLTLSDPLTGVANRVLLAERIDHAITRGKRHNTRIGVVMLSLKNFPALHKKLGEQATDRLLVTLARMLREAVRAEDTVSHLQDNTFAVALEGVFEREDIERAKEAVHRVFAEPVTLDEHTFTLEADLGSALYPTDGADAETLLRAAEHGITGNHKHRKPARSRSKKAD